MPDEMTAATEAWNDFWDARPDGSLITPLPLPDAKALAAHMFNAGLEQSRERQRALRAALKTVAEGYSWDGMEEAELTATEMQEFAQVALAGQTEQSEDGS